ncbi:MAG: outer membrane protein assembly factor BamD [Candidatus Babeliales bacterium]|nr:outer membrane protein assembly factor BamD [Candidatus Babeliales bacterium]
MSSKSTILLLLLTCTFNILPSLEVKLVEEVKPVKKTKVKKAPKPKLINKNFSDLTFEDLEHNKKIHIANNLDKGTLAKNVERMLSLCKDQDKICNIRLELADIYFDGNKLDKAATAYKEFVKLYPGNEKAEYAQYKEIQSNFKEALDFDRDQTKTKEALKLSQEFITKTKNEEYLKEIKQTIRQCKKKLLKSELSMFYFYLKKPNFKSAQRRLDYLKKDFFKNPENEILIKLQEHIKLAQDKKPYDPVDLDALDAAKNPKPVVKKKKDYVERF